MTQERAYHSLILTGNQQYGNITTKESEPATAGGQQDQGGQQGGQNKPGQGGQQQGGQNKPGQQGGQQ